MAWRVLIDFLLGVRSAVENYEQDTDSLNAVLHSCFTHDQVALGVLIAGNTAGSKKINSPSRRPLILLIPEAAVCIGCQLQESFVFLEAFEWCQRTVWLRQVPYGGAVGAGVIYSPSSRSGLPLPSRPAPFTVDIDLRVVCFGHPTNFHGQYLQAYCSEWRQPLGMFGIIKNYFYWTTRLVITVGRFVFQIGH